MNSRIGDHMEVAPRMWDKSIAANYVPTKTEHMHSEVANNDTTASVETEPSKKSLFSRFSEYMLPAIFVICVIIVVYVIWKYFTKYRKSRAVQDDQRAIEAPAKTKKVTFDPMQVLADEDLSKYEYDSEENEDEHLPPLIEVIEEESDEYESEDSLADEESNCEEEQEESEAEDNNSDEDKSEETEIPDIDAIQQMITGTDIEELPILEEDDMDVFTIEVEPPKPKKTRKPKRVTLN